MSSSLSQAQLEQSVQSWTTELLIQAATATWFLYDYLLTFPDEIRCIWQRQISAVTVVFFTMRYAAFLNLLNAVQNFVYWTGFRDGGVAECTLIWRLNAATEALFYLSLAGFVSIRVYAISGQNFRVSLLVFLLSTSFAISDGYINNIGKFLPRPAPSSGCFQTFIIGGQVGEVFGTKLATSTLYGTFGLIGTVCLFIAELIAQFYTWRSTWQIRRATRNSGGQRSIVLLIVQDGTVNYLVITVWAIISESVTTVDLRLMSVSVISICICRAMLRLRQVRFAEDPEGSTGTMSRISTRFVGNMGAPMDVSFMVRQPETSTEHDDLEGVVYVHGNPLMVDVEPDGPSA